MKHVYCVRLEASKANNAILYTYSFCWCETLSDSRNDWPCMWFGRCSLGAGKSDVPQIITRPDYNTPVNNNNVWISLHLTSCLLLFHVGISRCMFPRHSSTIRQWSMINHVRIIIPVECRKPTWTAVMWHPNKAWSISLNQKKHYCSPTNSKSQAIYVRDNLPLYLVKLIMLLRQYNARRSCSLMNIMRVRW